MIDIHSHILPEVDDGPKSWETAEAMCRMAAQDGIEYMVATPHANERYFYDRAYLTEPAGKTAAANWRKTKAWSGMRLSSLVREHAERDANAGKILH